MSETTLHLTETLGKLEVRGCFPSRKGKKLVAGLAKGAKITTPAARALVLHALRLFSFPSEVTVYGIRNHQNRRQAVQSLRGRQAQRREARSS